MRGVAVYKPPYFKVLFGFWRASCKVKRPPPPVPGAVRLWPQGDGQTIRLYGPVLKVYGRSFSVWPHDLAKEYSERVFSGCPYGDTTHPLYMYNTTKTLIRGEGEGHYRAAPGRQKTRHSHARVTHEQPTQAVESSGGCPRAGYIAQGALHARRGTSHAEVGAGGCAVSTRGGHGRGNLQRLIDDNMTEGAPEPSGRHGWWCGRRRMRWRRRGRRRRRRWRRRRRRWWRRRR